MWTKLRSCHRDALRRQRKCLKSGAAAETIKESVQGMEIAKAVGICVTVHSK